jgi:hypothetical protein
MDLFIQHAFISPMQHSPKVFINEYRKKTFSKLPYWLSSQHIGCQNPPPEKENKKTLIQDLDEILVHYSTFQNHPYVKSITVGSPPFTVFLRPGLQEFLDFALANFDVFVYQYGDKSYSKPILDLILLFLDENHRFYRDSCCY